MSRHLVARSGAAALAIVVVAFVPAVPAGAADPSSESVSRRAVSFLATQQRDDGGFGAAEEGFPGFETPDAVLAIAEAAQSTLVHDRAAALTAVRAVRRGGNDGLHYLDDLADAPGGARISAGKAAQLIMVAAAVGLPAGAFDPDGDGPADLVAIMDSGRRGDGSYGTFNDTLQAVLAHAVLGRTVPAETARHLASAQQTNGGFDFTGDPNQSSDDIDTTSRAIQALVAAGADPGGPAVREAIAFLARRHNEDGSWSSFGDPDPNSTAMAVLALTAAGYQVESRCWRDSHRGSAGSYTSPDRFLRSRQAPDGRIASPSDAFGVNTFATSQSVQALMRIWQPVARGDRQPCPSGGYRLLAADGGVFAFGTAAFHGSAGGLPLNQPVVAGAATPSGAGYWLFAADGGVFSFGDAPFLGSTGAFTLSRPVVAAAATPTGGGYWLFGADGGVFNFGDAPFLGSMGASRLNSPIVAGDATATGRGYRLFGADGGVFTFGDATFEGSMASRPLRETVVGAASSLTGRGYWLFARDGGVFAFGDAGFAGSAAGLMLSRPVVAGLGSHGEGYHLVASDGGVFSYGGAPFLGSLGDLRLNAPVVAATR